MNNLNKRHNFQAKEVLTRPQPKESYASFKDYYAVTKEVEANKSFDDKYNDFKEHIKQQKILEEER